MAEKMLTQEQFNAHVAILGNKLAMLWQLMYRAQRGVLMDEGISMFLRTLDEANRIHAQMFPTIERSLYDDSVKEFVEEN